MVVCAQMQDYEMPHLRGIIMSSNMKLHFSF